MSPTIVFPISPLYTRFTFPMLPVLTLPSGAGNLEAPAIYTLRPLTSVRMDDALLLSLALLEYPCMDTNPMVQSIASMDMTTMSSTRVNPERCPSFLRLLFIQDRMDLEFIFNRGNWNYRENGSTFYTRGNLKREGNFKALISYTYWSAILRRQLLLLP